MAVLINSKMVGLVVLINVANDWFFGCWQCGIISSLVSAIRGIVAVVNVVILRI